MRFAAVRFAVAVTCGGYMSKRSKEFSDLMRREHCKAPESRAVIEVEKQLGQGAVGYQLSARGKNLLFQALDKERSAKLSAQNG